MGGRVGGALETFRRGGCLGGGVFWEGWRGSVASPVWRTRRQRRKCSRRTGNVYPNVLLQNERCGRLQFSLFVRGFCASPVPRPLPTLPPSQHQQNAGWSVPLASAMPFPDSTSCDLNYSPP